jgi:uncharacterized damage-inducible protein DinB
MSSAVFNHVLYMNPKLEDKYLSLEESRNKLLNELKGLDDTQLNACLIEGKWSIGQIVAHLVQVEQLTYSYIRKKLDQEEGLRNTTLKNTINSTLLRLALKSGMKFKAPQVIAELPQIVSIPELWSQWNDLRYTLEDMLTEMPPALIDKCVFRHPFAGMLTIGQTLTFIQDHFNHHLPQVHQLKQQLLK